MISAAPGSRPANPAPAASPGQAAGQAGRSWHQAPAFLEIPGLDPAEPRFADRIRVLQVARMLEQLATGNLEPGIARIVADRLHATLS